MTEHSEERATYRSIVRASALLGGASAVGIVLGLARAKTMAILLGPAGVGLLSLYMQIVELARSVAGMGVGNSGVRHIAEAVGSGDLARVARTAAALRWTAAALGLGGGALLVAWSSQVSTLTFGGSAQAPWVALLGVVVVLNVVADAQAAVLQGMRRVRALARIGVLISGASTAVSVALVYWLRVDGIVPSVVAGAAIAMGIFWWYRRTVTLPPVLGGIRELVREQVDLLKLGLAFMASAVMMMGVTYAVRLLVVREAGLEGAGLYQCAWTLGGLYVGFILQAMGMDFYPRLTAEAGDRNACNRIVNEQAQVSLLLAGPGVVGTMALAPVVIRLLYSPEFHAAAQLLQWIGLGMALRTVSWPMGYIVLAQGKRGVFLATEVAWVVVYWILARSCIEIFGLSGAGIAFAGSYLFHWVMIQGVARRLSAFRWTRANVRLVAAFVVMVAGVRAGFVLLPPPVASAIGLTVAVLSGGYSLVRLLNLTCGAEVLRSIRRLAWSGSGG